MFHSLYQQAQTPSAPDTAQPWPATYLDAMADLTPAQWTLTVDGLVEKPRSFTYSEFLALQPALSQQERRLISAEGWSYRGQFEGILLAALVNAVKPSPQAKFLIQTNASDHQTAIDLTMAIREKAMFCHRVNGQALSPLYGGPIRLMVFHRFSHKGLGQVTRLTFSETPLEASQDFWVHKGYTLEGTVSPGDYYAFDLGAFRPIREPEQVS
ncbi:MAG: molybdopterin-dependent oxidoreductase [Candidatus Melainabacteria bacterium]